MASASPSASMTVVLEVGARFSGQASCSMFTSRKDMRILRQGRFGVAAHRDDPDLKPRDRRQDPQHFFRLAARAQGENDVAIGHHPEIAVQRVERIEHDRGRTGAGEGRATTRSPCGPGWTS